jgi:hypothetical protein
LGTARQFTLEQTAAEPALRDHWQRDVHACSDCTFSHSEIVRNKNAPGRCAKPVDEKTCLWKLAENAGNIPKLIESTLLH